MTTIVKVWESKSLIRFPDCDPFNHLNNARYLDYFINAREDQLMKYLGFNIYSYAVENGLSWVVSKNQIVYIKPVYLMETVVIDSTILELREKDLLVEMKMWNEKKDKLKSVLWSNFAHINLKTQKPETHSKEFIEIFKPLENLLLKPVSFDERVENFRNISSA